MAVSAAQIRAASAYVEVSIRENLLNKQLKNLENRLRKFGNSMRSIGTRLFAAGAGAALPFGLSVKAFGEFDNLIQEFKAIAKVGSVSLDTIEMKIKQLGRTTSFTAAEIADAAIVLSRLGFSTTEIDDTIDSVTALARATRTDLARSAQIAGDLMRALGLDSKQADKFIDQLVATTNSSSQNLEEMFESLKNFAPMAKNADVFAKQVLAMNAALADSGIKASLAGTMMRRLITNISDGERADWVKKHLDVDFADAFGNLRDPLDIIKEMRDAMEDLGKGSMEKVGIMNKVFEVRGSAAAFILGDGYKKIREIEKSLDSVGDVAEKTAKKIDKGLGNQFRILMSAVAGVGIAIGESLKKPLVTLIGVFTEALDRLSKFVEKNHDLVRIVALSAVGVMLAGGAMLAMAAAAFTLSTTLSLIGSAISLLLSPFALLTRFAGAGAGYLVGFIDKIKSLLSIKVISDAALWNIGSTAFVKGLYAGWVALKGFGTALAKVAVAGAKFTAVNWRALLNIGLGFAMHSYVGWAQVVLEVSTRLISVARNTGRSVGRTFRVIRIQIARTFLSIRRVANTFGVAVSKNLILLFRWMNKLARAVLQFGAVFVTAINTSQRTIDFQKIFGGLQSMLPRVIALMRSAGRSLLAFSGGGKAIAWLRSAFTSALPHIIKFAKMVPAATKSVAFGFLSVSRAVFGAIPGIIKFEIIFKAIEGVIFSIVTAANNAMQAFSGFGNSLGIAFESITTAFNVGEFGVALESIWLIVQNVFLRIKRFIVGTVVDIKAGFQAFIDPWVELGTTIYNSVMTAFTRLFSGLSGVLPGVGGFFDSFIGFFDDFVYNVVTALTIASNEVEKFGAYLAKTQIQMGNKTSETLTAESAKELVRNNSDYFDFSFGSQLDQISDLITRLGKGEDLDLLKELNSRKLVGGMEISQGQFGKMMEYYGGNKDKLLRDIGAQVWDANQAEAARAAQSLIGRNKGEVLNEVEEKRFEAWKRQKDADLNKALAQSEADRQKRSAERMNSAQQAKQAIDDAIKANDAEQEALQQKAVNQAQVKALGSFLENTQKTIARQAPAFVDNNWFLRTMLGRGKSPVPPAAKDAPEILASVASSGGFSAFSVSQSARGDRLVDIQQQIKEATERTAAGVEAMGGTITRLKTAVIGGA